MLVRELIRLCSLRTPMKAVDHEVLTDASIGSSGKKKKKKTKKKKKNLRSELGKRSIAHDSAPSGSARAGVLRDSSFDEAGPRRVNCTVCGDDRSPN